jgi:hypothetical protein
MFFISVLITRNYRENLNYTKLNKAVVKYDDFDHYFINIFFNGSGERFFGFFICGIFCIIVSMKATSIQQHFQQGSSSRG